MQPENSGDKPWDEAEDEQAAMMGSIHEGGRTRPLNK